jgi:hypothetical protein
MGKINLQRLGRRTKNTIKRVGTIVQKGARVVRGIVGTVDKISGGRLSQAINTHPAGKAIMTGVNMIANK